MEEALRHVKALSFPRRTGSTGEAQAQEYIVSRFKALGMEPEVEEFSFTPILGLLSKGFLLIVLLSLTALHLLSPFYPFLGVTLSLYILILTLGFLWGRPVVALLGWALFKELPLIRKLHSKNIMASWPSEFGMWNSEFGISNPQSKTPNPQSTIHNRKATLQNRQHKSTSLPIMTPRARPSPLGGVFHW